MQNRFLNKEVLELNQLRQQAIDRWVVNVKFVFCLYNFHLFIDISV